MGLSSCYPTVRLEQPISQTEALLQRPSSMEKEEAKSKCLCTLKGFKEARHGLDTVFNTEKSKQIDLKKKKNCSS